MKINGYTRVCGVIGHPVEHTMSPAIHNTLAANMNQNLTYVPFHVSEGFVGDAIRGAYALNLLGCNVTVPYKSEVIPYLADIDPLARNIGAVNTLVRVENGFKGYNTDMPGLYRAMMEDEVHIENRNVLILGAGGVARAVAMLLADKKAKRIVILNRTLEKAQCIADEVNSLMCGKLVEALPLDAYAELDGGEKWLCIQATNVGMFPKQEEVLITDPRFYRMIHTGYDLIFNPAETRFMALTRQAGGRAYNGLKMLLWQGIIAYELWTGEEVSRELADKSFEEMKSVMGLL